MKKFIALLLLLFPLPSWCWNYTGHVIIAQIAYDNLLPVAKKKADKLANLIYQELPLKQQEKLEYL